MLDRQIVECVPNFSEGVWIRDKVQAIVRAMRVDGVSLLDWSADRDHNRSVVTIAGTPEAVVESAVRGAGEAAKLIDLTAQRGGTSADWGGGCDSVCAGTGDLVRAVRGPGAAGWGGDLAPVWRASVFL